MPDRNIDPFGNPDGSRADLDQITHGFVEFANERVWGGLATRADDFTARVIVGRKGSGKTVYLRRQHLAARSSDDLFAGAIEVAPPPTEVVVAFCQLFSSGRLHEAWKTAWLRAILRSVTSYLLNEKTLAVAVPEQTRQHLYEDFRDLLEPIEPYTSTLGVYGELRAILSQYRMTTNRMAQYLNHPAWDQLEQHVHQALLSCRPICLYLDAVDENFESAPMYWLNCQRGLFSAVMQLLRDARFGGRLHVVTCVRDVVFLKVLQGEHATRYLEEPHIRLLDWNYHAILSLLKQKVQRLDDEYFPEGEGDKTLHRWLGITIVNNVRRGVLEPLESYMLRHTRLLPRDVVVLGNIACRENEKAKFFEEKDDDSKAVRHAVRISSGQFGKEQLSICAHQILSDMMPSSAGRYDYTELYTGPNEYHRKLVDDLRDFIGCIGKDRFTRAELREIDEAAIQLFGEGVDVLSALWLNGLLGYVDRRGGGTCVVFYNDSRSLEFLLPRDCEHYALHSCVLDAVRLQAVGEPVTQCR